MKAIFISYRREDAAPYAGRLHDHLTRAFPMLSVFMDVAAVAPGADFVEAIDRTLSASGVVLAVIGPTWTTVADSSGQRRLESSGDYVAHELAVALESDATVVPILVGGATMPRAESLPPRLQSLTRRNAIALSDAQFAADFEKLRNGILDALGMRPTESVSVGRAAAERFFTEEEISRARSRLRTALWATYALTALLLAWVVWGGNQSWPAATLVSNAVLFGLWAWVNVKVLAGKRWARNAELFIVGLLAVALFDAISFDSLGQLGLFGVCLAGYLWIARLVLTDPVRRWFSRG